MDLCQHFRTSGPTALNNKKFRFCPQCASPFETTDLAPLQRQRCHHCGYVHFLNPAPGITVILHSPERKVLIGRRGPQAKYGGLWCLPGGYIEFEESFIATVHRELREETGLKINIEGVINVVSNLLDDHHHTLVIVMLGTVREGMPVAGDDLDQLRWVSQREHEGTSYAFAADKKIIDVFFSGLFNLLPIDPQAENQMRRGGEEKR